MKGFVNIGNTCYLNSGLQMLMQNIDLCNLILNYKKYNNDIKQIGEFIEEYHTDKLGTLTPLSIKTIVEKKNNIFSGYNQQDAGEFIIFLLDFIDEEIKKHQSIKTGIKPLFNIKSNIRIKCKKLSCLNITNTLDENNYLLLDIGDECKTLDDCYKLSKSADKLCGDNMYNCSKCKTKTIASKRVQVIEWGPNLIISLKRFKQNGLRLQKNTKQIEIPLIWRTNYKLYGAVIHGGTLNGGHYTYVGNYNNKWYHFNDTHVSIINDNDIHNYIINAYIFYYKRLA
jgi:ubiquitin C-terminal hydrolase